MNKALTVSVSDNWRENFFKRQERTISVTNSAIIFDNPSLSKWPNKWGKNDITIAKEPVLERTLKISFKLDSLSDAYVTTYTRRLLKKYTVLHFLVMLFYPIYFVIDILFYRSYTKKFNELLNELKTHGYTIS